MFYIEGKKPPFIGEIARNGVIGFRIHGGGIHHDIQVHAVPGESNEFSSR